MESNQSCIATDEKLADNLTIVQIITIALLSLIIVLIILGLLIGVLLQLTCCGCCKSPKWRQTTGLLSTGVIVKLALIPGVEDEIARDGESGGGTNRERGPHTNGADVENNTVRDPGSGEGTNRERSPHTNGADVENNTVRDPGSGGGTNRERSPPTNDTDVENNTVRDPGSGGGTNWERNPPTNGTDVENNTVRDPGSGGGTNRERNPPTNGADVENNIVRDPGSGEGTNRERSPQGPSVDVEKVYLKVSANCPGEEKFEWYKFNKMFSILLFPGAMVLVLAYTSVFITSLLELSEDCQDANSVNSPKNCYTDISRCPPLNCDLWKELGRNSTLMLVCISYTPDLFNPLERFVSLLAVQVALLSFYSCCCNRGCSVSTWCRYCSMCVFNLVFLVVLGTITTLVWTGIIPGLERNKAFVNMVVPFIHLLFVSLVESYILLVFVLILCYDKPKKMSPSGSIVPMEVESPGTTPMPTLQRDTHTTNTASTYRIHTTDRASNYRIVTL